MPLRVALKKKRPNGSRGRTYSRSRPKSYGGRARNSTLVVMPNTLSDRTRVMLKYSSWTSITNTGGSSNYDQFVGNGIFDPYYATGGEQPMGFDQWNNFYNKHVVTGSKIVCKFGNVGSTAGTQSAIVAITPVPNTTAVTADNYLETVRESKYTKWQLMNISDQATITHNMSTAKIFGKNKQQILAEDNFSGSASANPASQWLWQISTDALDGTSNVTMYCVIDIYYFIEFYDRKSLVGST